jgi:hypothetical protein
MGMAKLGERRRSMSADDETGAVGVDQNGGGLKRSGGGRTWALSPRVAACSA